MGKRQTSKQHIQSPDVLDFNNHVLSISLGQATHCTLTCTMLFSLTTSSMRQIGSFPL